MWMLALIIACSPTQDVCTYKSDTTVTSSFEDCQRLGHFMGGRAMVQAYGSFPIGPVEVTCRPVVAPITVTGIAPGRLQEPSVGLPGRGF